AATARRAGPPSSEAGRFAWARLRVPGGASARRPRRGAPRPRRTRVSFRPNRDLDARPILAVLLELDLPGARAAREVDLGVVLLALVLRHVVARALERVLVRVERILELAVAVALDDVRRPGVALGSVDHAVGRREAVGKCRLLGDLGRRVAAGALRLAVALLVSSAAGGEAHDEREQDQCGIPLDHSRVPLCPVDGPSTGLVDDGEGRA